METAIAIISGVFAALVNKLWNNAKAKAEAKAKEIKEQAEAKLVELKAKITTVLAETGTVMRHLVLSADESTTFDQMKIWLKGAAAIRLAAAGLDPKDPLIMPGINKLIAEMLDLFWTAKVKNQPPPILAEIKQAFPKTLDLVKEMK